MTTRCGNCKFYEETDKTLKTGLCGIKLPVWWNVKIITDGANIVASDDACDLGDDDDEL